MTTSAGEGAGGDPEQKSVGVHNKTVITPLNIKEGGHQAYLGNIEGPIPDE